MTRRSDHETRDRITKLVEGMEAHRESLDRRYRRVVLLALAAVLIALATAGVAWHNASQVNESLCTFRQDLEQRASTGRAFLREHPEGIAGIPAATLAQNLANQQRTVDSLSDLDCRPPTE